MEKNIKITVLGGGLWGTVLAQHLCQGAPRRRVWLWEFFESQAEALKRQRRHPHLPGFRLDSSIEVGSDLGAAVAQSDVLIFVLPSSAVGSTAVSVSRVLGRKPVLAVNASKGLEARTLRTMSEVIAARLPQARGLYTLSGPSFAREVARGVPTKLVLAGPGGADARLLLRLLDGGILRVQWIADRKGVELGGSLKNALAIGCGILDGLGGRGANTKAAMIVQGMNELGRIVAVCGGRRDTIFGLTGLGDLIATGTSPESRNRAFGEKLGQGKSPRIAREEIPTVVEGIDAVEAAYALCRRKSVKAPLIEAIWKVVHQGRPAGLIDQALGFN
ncbi:MAG: NAD(P)H-dependent glycerol-3-phosphate dehydrogenase [Elusimicrobia bacterium]|nr:NAD(P)H-dependent glycerol-3-phosphate dehydrogenase [Elusimicrobiota bacterium]